MKILIYFGLIFLFSYFLETSAQTQPAVINSAQFGPENQGKTKVTVLGVFHFADPGLDSYKPKFPFNILEKNRQKELEDLLERLRAFNPTKIILECNRVEFDSLLNERYRQFRSGEIKIRDKHSEIFQIGFKLANMLGHEKIFCSDATAEWFGADLDWENFDHGGYLKSLGQYDKVSRYDYFKDYEKYDSLKTVQKCAVYFPIQKLAKMLPSSSSFVTSPVISPK